MFPRLAPPTPTLRPVRVCPLSMASPQETDEGRRLANPWNCRSWRGSGATGGLASASTDTCKNTLCSTQTVWAVWTAQVRSNEKKQGACRRWTGSVCHIFIPRVCVCVCREWFSAEPEDRCWRASGQHALLAWKRLLQLCLQGLDPAGEAFWW